MYMSMAYLNIYEIHAGQGFNCLQNQHQERDLLKPVSESENVVMLETL